jgi:hypothetical protein
VELAPTLLTGDELHVHEPQHVDEKSTGWMCISGQHRR